MPQLRGNGGAGLVVAFARRGSHCGGSCRDLILLRGRSAVMLLRCLARSARLLEVVVVLGASKAVLSDLLVLMVVVLIWLIVVATSWMKV